MISSRFISQLKILSRSSNIKLYGSKLQQIRHSGDGVKWSYRERTETPKWAKRDSLIIATVFWWWFYWNLYHGWRHLIGMYDGKSFLPNPRDWKDEELGIPPDYA